MTYNTAAIRELLKSVFDDQELGIFCYDHFRSVYQKFADTTSQMAKIQFLIDHCDRYVKFDELLALIEKKNRTQYDRFIVKIREKREKPNPSNNSVVGLESLRAIGENEVILLTPESPLNRRCRVEIVLGSEFCSPSAEQLSAAVGALAGALNIHRDQIKIVSKSSDK